MLERDVRATARLIRGIDDLNPGVWQALDPLAVHAGKARIIGITGAPGVGKSTLTGQLARHYVARGERVAVVAVDPSSPYSGGAVLGDRIRFDAISADVFVTSLATRGALGGLSRALPAVLLVLDAFGVDRVLVETVGVGQDEVDVAAVADATVVVLVPGLGDDVQAIKSGLLEIADLYVVNKADRPGAKRLLADLELSRESRALRTGSRPDALLCQALSGLGVAEVAAALDAMPTPNRLGRARIALAVKSAVQARFDQALTRALALRREPVGPLHTFDEAVSSLWDDVTVESP